MTAFNIEFACLTDVGVRRSHNQDSYVAVPAGDESQWRECGHLFVIADGMGAHAVGELASKLAVDEIPHLFTKHLAAEGPGAALRRAFTEANAFIHEKGQQNRDFEGMGTTGSGLLLRPEGAWIAQVGDSRVYRVRGGKIEQLSFDHSLLWELARRQGCKPEDLPGIPHNVIVRSLGPEPNVQVDIEGPHPLHKGDIFVLCSDGLSGPVSDREIGAVVASLPPAQACQFLVDLANLQGGPDNITVMIVRVGAVPSLPTRSVQPHTPRWVRKLPWPMIALAAGIGFALLALALTQSQDSSWATTAFIAAAVAIAVGMVGLLVQARLESAGQPDAGPARLNVYRQFSCDIQMPLLQKLARAEGNLQDRLREKEWPVDWAVAQQHHDQARHFQDKGDLAHAFREYCLAMRPLAEAVQRERHKEELFHPLWVKGEEELENGSAK